MTVLNAIFVELSQKVESLRGNAIVTIVSAALMLTFFALTAGVVETFQFQALTVFKLVLFTIGFAVSFYFSSAAFTR